MDKIRLIAGRELRQRLRQRGFLISTLVVPLVMILMVAIMGSTAGSANVALTLDTTDVATLGYVDEAGLISEIPDPVPVSLLIGYADDAAAQAALAAGEIAAYYVIPADYPSTGELRRVSAELPMVPRDGELFRYVLISNLYSDLGGAEIARLRNPLGEQGVAYAPLDGSALGGGPGSMVLPLAVTMVVLIPIFSSGGLLLQSLVNEKEKRVLEMLLLSLRPQELLVGKVLGLGAVALLQYAVWIAFGAALTAVGAAGEDGMTSRFDILRQLPLTPQEIALTVAYALGCFGLYASLMAGVGALASDMEGNRAAIFLLSLPMILPVYLISAITAAPHGTMATALSLIPFSAPVAMLVRMTATTVPGWQIAASLGGLFVMALILLWVMTRLFRAKTLLSGEGLSVRRFAAAVFEG